MTTRITVEVPDDETEAVLALLVIRPEHWKVSARKAARARIKTSTTRSNAREIEEALKGRVLSPSKADSSDIRRRIAAVYEWAKKHGIVVGSKWMPMNIARIALPDELLLQSMDEILAREGGRIRSLHYFYSALQERESDRFKAAPVDTPRGGGFQRIGA